MDDSILTSIKKILGISEEYTYFDQDIIIHINSVLSTLNQLGVGPEKGFSITDKRATWSDILEDNSKIEFVKSYIGLRVKLLFDPPNNSSVIEAMNKQISEFEWRILAVTDYTTK